MRARPRSFFVDQKTSLLELSTIWEVCPHWSKSRSKTELKFNRQVSTVVHSCFFYLRTITKINPCLFPADLLKVILTLLFSHLDNCNALYAELYDATIKQLQLVQNAAARLVMGTRMRDHICPALVALYWLPVKWRPKFKIVTFVWGLKALNNLALE